MFLSVKHTQRLEPPILVSPFCLTFSPKTTEIKNASVSYRSGLKLQLQRQQAEEEKKREIEYSQSLKTSYIPTIGIDVPALTSQSQQSDVPSQVLQVKLDPNLQYAVSVVMLYVVMLALVTLSVVMLPLVMLVLVMFCSYVVCSYVVSCNVVCSYVGSSYVFVVMLYVVMLYLVMLALVMLFVVSLVMLSEIFWLVKMILG